MARRRGWRFHGPRVAQPVAPQPMPLPAVAPRRRPAAQPIAAVPEPVFFFGFELPAAKLAFARFWIFGVLAIDAFFQLSHAPRYGAGGFNVAHLPWLDGVAPGRVVVGAAYVVLTYVFAAIAVGVGSRGLVAVAAALYAWIYAVSQLDSYQHHYLVALVLVLACFVPWFAPTGAVRSWALRLVLVELGIVYLWTAIAKIDDAWLDGTALSVQLGDGAIRTAIDATIGFKAAAGLVILVELFLAGAIWCRPLWRFAWPIGLALHLGIAFTDLEIGLFSWIMVALYTLVIPDRWFLAAWGAIPKVRIPTMPVWLRHLVLGGAALGLVFALPLPIDGVLGATLAAIVAVVASDVLRRRQPVPRSGVWTATLLAAALTVVLSWSTDVVPDYYRYWAGASRRLGDPATALYAYARMVEVAPDEPDGHFQLGRLLLAPGTDRDDARGLAELDRAAALEPARARALIEKARFLSSTGRRDAALVAARAARVAEPTHPDVDALVARLERGDVEASPP